MTDPGQLVHLLRNTPVREIIRALERDNFSLRRTTQTGGHIYVHSDRERRVVIHYHHGSDVLKVSPEKVCSLSFPGLTGESR